MLSLKATTRNDNLQQLAKVHSCHWKGKSIVTYLDLCVLFYVWIVVCLLLTVQWLWDCWLSFIMSFCCIDAGMTMHTVTISQWDRDMKRLWLWSIEMWQEGSAHLGSFGQKVMHFAQCAKLSSLGRQFRAKNSNRPDAGTADNSLFQEFFRLRVQKMCFPMYHNTCAT